MSTITDPDADPSTGRPTSLGQVHITVADLDRAIAFYRDGLGLDLLFTVPGQSMAFLQVGDTRLYLGAAESPEFRSSPVLYFTVGDIHVAHTAMTARDVPFVEAPHIVHRTPASELWMAFARDPDGNHVAIMQDAPVA